MYLGVVLKQNGESYKAASEESDEAGASEKLYVCTACDTIEDTCE